MKRIIAILTLLILCPALGWGALYCVKPDGTCTAANKANAVVAGEGNCTAQGTAGNALSMATANLLTGANAVAAGDTVLYSARNLAGADASYTGTMTPLSAGSVGLNVTYLGISDGTTQVKPLIDVSGSAANLIGIGITGMDYIRISNFQIKGSGGAAAMYVYGSSGTAGAGLTVLVDNVDVLSNYGSSTGNNDCFAHGGGSGETAQAAYTSITATGCRPNPQASGGHQAFTLHEDAKATITTATFSGSNYGITNTLNTQLTASGLTISNMMYENVGFGSNATPTGFITISGSTITVANGSGLVGIGNGATGGTITIGTSTINFGVGGADFVYGGTVNLSNNTIVWADTGEAGYISTKSGGTINFGPNNTVVFTSGRVGNIVGDTGTLNVYRNTFYGGTVQVLSGTNNVWSNTFKDLGNDAGWTLGGLVSWYNNTHYNSTKAGTGLYCQTGSGFISRNNIFYNVTYPCNGNNCNTTGYDSDYNIYYNSTAVTNPGTRSLTSNPLFVAPGTDFSLQLHSPAVGAGTNLGATYATDFDGVLQGCHGWDIGSRVARLPNGETCWGRSTAVMK